MSVEPPPLPPLASGEHHAVPRPTDRRVGWWVHLLILLAYPLCLGLLGSAQVQAHDAPMLPGSVAGLIAVCVFELAIFGVVFGVAWAASRARAIDLHLGWNDGPLPIVRGFGYSIALRIMVAIATLAVLAVGLASGAFDSQTFNKTGPQLDAMVDSGTLKDNPAYLLIAMTLLSFVVAGLREELWRAGVIAALLALFPKTFAGARGKIAAVMIAAVVFGLGHLPQGWIAVGMIGLLGVGLGLILVFHRSLWDAVIAHGFFDAASFAMLYLLANLPPELLKRMGME
jgi:membrane protease YdiL (CAAX protease family)